MWLDLLKDWSVNNINKNIAFPYIHLVEHTITHRNPYSDAEDNVQINKLQQKQQQGQIQCDKQLFFLSFSFNNPRDP